MPTFTHGRSTRVLYGINDLSSYLKQASPSVTIDTPDTTAFGATVKSYVTGIGDGKVSTTGMFDGTAGAVDELLQSAFGQPTPTPLIVAPQGLTAVGERCWMLNTLLSNYNMTAAVSDMVGITADFQGTGAVKTGPVLSLLDTSNTIASATVAGTAVKDVAGTSATTFGGFGVLMVQTNTTNQELTCVIEHAPDSNGAAGTYAQLLSFTVVASGTKSAQLISLAPGTNVNPWLRAKFTSTVGTGSHSTHVSFARNSF